MGKASLPVYLVICAAEAGPHGSLGRESRLRIGRAARFLREHPEAVTLCASEVIALHEPGGRQAFADLVVLELAHEGIPQDRVIALPGFGQTTLDEIELVTAYEAAHPAGAMYFVTTWYHVPRTMLMWWWQHGRCGTPVPSCEMSAYTLYRAALEPFKMIFALCPLRVQQVVGLAARALRIHQ